jgi:hypothetical protein
MRREGLREGHNKRMPISSVKGNWSRTLVQRRRNNKAGPDIENLVPS